MVAAYSCGGNVAGFFLKAVSEVLEIQLICNKKGYFFLLLSLPLTPSFPLAFHLAWL